MASLGPNTAMLRVAQRPGQAFGLSVATIVALFAGLFVELFPNAIVSSGPGPDLSLHAASSTSYTLTVMTVVAAVFVPLVLLYQGWTYWVFRARLGAEDFEGVHGPIDLLERRAEGRPAGKAPTPSAPSGP